MTGAKSSPDSGSGKDEKSAPVFRNLFSDEKGFFIAPEQRLGSLCIANQGS
jgi:hypothetical protein